MPVATTQSIASPSAYIPSYYNPCKTTGSESYYFKDAEKVNTEKLVPDVAHIIATQLDIQSEEHTTEEESAVSVVAEEINEATRQTWRLNAVPGSVVVFVSAGYEGKRFVFDIAKQMQLRVVIIDACGSWSEQLVAEGLADQFLPINIEHLDDATFVACANAIATVKEDFGRLDAIVSFCELSQPLVAQLTCHFGLPGNTVESVLAARDKSQSRAMFLQAGLPSAKFYCIKEDADCTAAAQHVGFPAVIKPVSGAASIGVLRVDNLTALEDGVQWVRSQLVGARVVNGALQEGTEEFQEAGCDAAGWIDTTIMLEEYLDGQEVDVDVILVNGEPLYEAVTDNWPTVEPYFNETIANCPSVLSSEKQDELRSLAVASCKALGLATGVFHVEAKYTSRGARIIEVNCRMGGGAVYLINRAVHGVDLVVEQLILSCGGQPLDRVDTKEAWCCVAEYTINCPRSGVVKHADFLAPWKANPRMLLATTLVQPGQKVTGPDRGMPTWLCDVMCAASSVEKALKFIRDLEAEMEYPIVDELP